MLVFWFVFIVKEVGDPSSEDHFDLTDMGLGALVQIEAFLYLHVWDPPCWPRLKVNFQEELENWSD